MSLDKFLSECNEQIDAFTSEIEELEHLIELFDTHVTVFDAQDRQWVKERLARTKQLKADLAEHCTRQRQLYDAEVREMDTTVTHRQTVLNQLEQRGTWKRLPDLRDKFAKKQSELIRLNADVSRMFFERLQKK